MTLSCIEIAEKC